MKLLNPGPVSLSARVRAALASPDECHREEPFAKLVDSVRARLREPAFVPALLAGSGTAAVEAMFSVVGPKDRTLVIANGVYGERMARMLERQRKPHEVLAHEWTSAIDLDALENALARGRFRFVAVVHHETTTGRLNPLAAIGALAAKHEARLLVDAVSSFGAEEILLHEWNVEAIASTANKCLQGAPGVSFVLVRESALARPSGATCLYLDLHEHASRMPFTLPTHVMRAFHAALVELTAEGGWRARRARYRERLGRVRAAIRMEPLLDATEGASSLAAFRLPPGTTYATFHARMAAAGFVVYAGQGNLTDIVRIAVMGDLSEADLLRLERALGAARDAG